MITISTGRGDKGKTSLYGGKKVPKKHSLVSLNGALDELQVYVGWMKIQLSDSRLKKQFTELQHFFYQIMGEIAGGKTIENFFLIQWLERIEKTQNTKQKGTYISNQFVLPGENKLEVSAHILRVKTRSFERLLCNTSIDYPKLKRFIPFFNRLSDYFFVLSQYFLRNR